MPRIFILATFAMAVAVSCLFADELADAGKQITRPDARRALSNYQEAVKTARANFDKQMDASRKRLLDELDTAQTKAAREKQFDEALAIRDLRRSIEQKSHVASDNELQIISAFYGQNVSWLDVTDKVRDAAKDRSTWKFTVNSNDLGDPVPGWTGTRTLLVRYSIGGKTLNKAVYEGKEITLP